MLVERIADEIRATGPMTFARFMELALYDPEAGYYTRRTPRGPGPRAATSSTAPEGHPIFGWAIARQLEEVWARSAARRGSSSASTAPARARSPPGSSTACADPARALLAAIRYQAIDVAPRRASRRFAARLARGRPRRPTSSRPTTGPAAGVVLANELLDALPVHRVEGGPDGGSASASSRSTPRRRRSRDVAGSGRRRRRPSRPASTAEGVELEPGQPAEICLELDAWLDRRGRRRSSAACCSSSTTATPPTSCTTPARGSTLRAYHRHRVHADPLVAIGRQDLTAHVDLTAVERAATAAGLDAARPDHARPSFLADLGIGDLLVGLQAEPGDDAGGVPRGASRRVVRMLDPRATGAFAVLAFGRGLPAEPPLRGFAPRAERPPAEHGPSR